MRYPAPDVARGFMLLFIALANVPFWTAVTHVSAPSDAVDTAWLWARSLLIDSRAYPLFAMLFGFGLVTMVNRRIASGASSYLSSLPGVEAGREPTSQEAAWAREQATVDARRLVRRRGLWMILFGAVHALLFSGDIIGPYGLVAVIFAGWIARKHWKRAVAFCAVVVVAGAVTFLNMGSFLASQGAASATDAHQGAGASTDTVLSYVSDGLLAWGGSLVSALFFSMIVPAMFLGARLADTDLISHPERHRGLLTVAGIGGLALGALGALHESLVPLTSAQPWAADSALIMILGLAGGCGWLAVLALYAGGPTADNRLTGLRWLLSNVGRRSMTAYLSQTVMFAGIFVIAPRLTGRSVSLGVTASAAVAVMVWLTTVILCAVLERLGMPGPFESLLRIAVARSERSRTNPFPQQIPAQCAAQFLGRSTSAPVTAGA